MPRLQLVLEGLTREHAAASASKRRLRLAMTPDVLVKVFEAARSHATPATNIHAPEHPLLLEAVCSVLFLAAARPGELTLSNKASGGLRIRDWKLLQEGPTQTTRAVLQLPCRKNDQSGSDHSDIIIGVTGTEICALQSMAAYRPLQKLKTTFAP